METIVLGFLIGHQEFLAAPLNDKGQLIKNLWGNVSIITFTEPITVLHGKKEFKKDAKVHTSSLVEYCCNKMAIRNGNYRKIIH